MSRVLKKIKAFPAPWVCPDARMSLVWTYEYQLLKQAVFGKTKLIRQEARDKLKTLRAWRDDDAKQGFGIYENL